jgi:Fic family protein
MNRLECGSDAEARDPGVDNVEAVEQAVRDSDRPLSAERLLAWHRRLMRRSRLPARHVSRLREEPGWIGGTTPLDAAYVPPPLEAVGELLEDLVAFANRGDLPVVAQAAIAHAQFEVIHPLGDGKGRVGRAPQADARHWRAVE